MRVSSWLDRKRCAAWLGAILTALPLAVSAAPAPALPAYALTDLGANADGAAINDRGDLLIYRAVDTPAPGLFLYRQGHAPVNLTSLLPPGNGGWNGASLSPAGDVAGNFFGSTSDGGQRGFVYSDGNVQFFDPDSGYPGPQVFGVNAWRQVVGLFESQDDGLAHGFLRQPSGAFIDLGTFGGGDGGCAVAINNLGQILAVAYEPISELDFRESVVLTGPGGSAPKNLGNLGGQFCTPTALNDFGQAVGSATLGNQADGPEHAFLYDGAKLRDLGAFLGAQFTEPTALNNRGEFVGDSHDVPFSKSRAWVYLRGRAYDLTNLVSPARPGWTVTFASGINDFGDIVGTARDATAGGGKLHAVLLRRVR